MSIEDEMRKIGFTVNIPHRTELEYVEETDDDSYRASLISQQILKYLAAKLEGLEGRVSLKYNGNIPLAYKEALESYADIFLSLQISIKTSVDQSVAVVHYFSGKGMSSLQLASHLVGRLKDTGIFYKADSKENDPVVPVDKAIPSAIIIMGLGNDAMCDYNSDRDEFIVRLADEICYGIVDGYVELVKEIGNDAEIRDVPFD